MKLPCKLLRPGAQLPTYAHEGDSGFDVRWLPNGDEPWVSTEGKSILNAGFTRLFCTGLAFDIPDGFELQVRPRSSVSKRGVLTHLGTVDSQYRGEVKVLLTNVGRGDGFDVNVGDRIAQLVLAPVVRAEIVETVELSETVRNDRGFGSSGRR